MTLKLTSDFKNACNVIRKSIPNEDKKTLLEFEWIVQVIVAHSLEELYETGFSNETHAR